ncbi:MAG: DUF3878 family protein [Blautia sp.]
MVDTLVMLQELLEQNQFELLFPETDKIVLVYLMNDAVESFLVFHEVRMTGEYKKDYEGKLEASLRHDGQEYILTVDQGESVVTLFFKDLLLDVHLYDYGRIGHFWVKGYEYLRQLEYRIAIMRDKYDYLGEEFCTPMEQRLALLRDFPPLNYCCYLSVPAKYVIPKEQPWVPDEKAIDVMMELAKEAEDYRMQRILRVYIRYPYPGIAKQIARMFRKNTHERLVNLLTDKLEEAVGGYPKRSFGKETDGKIRQLIKKAEKRQKELQVQGMESVILREEPFSIAPDGIDFQVYLMVWKKGWKNRKVKIESWGRED